jgi:hypothetical protein
MAGKDRLEPLGDGFIAFHDESGRRWKHKDIEQAVTGPGYRVFISDTGEERRYEFGPHESHDATLFDLRRQLGLAKPAPSGAPASGGATSGAPASEVGGAA